MGHYRWSPSSPRSGAWSHSPLLCQSTRSGYRRLQTKVDLPVTPGHVPSSLWLKQRVSTDTQLSFRDLDLATLAGGLTTGCAASTCLLLKLLAQKPRKGCGRTYQDAIWGLRRPCLRIPRVLWDFDRGFSELRRQEVRCGCSYPRFLGCEQARGAWRGKRKSQWLRTVISTNSFSPGNPLSLSSNSNRDQSSERD